MINAFSVTTAKTACTVLRHVNKIRPNVSQTRKDYLIIPYYTKYYSLFMDQFSYRRH